MSPTWADSGIAAGSVTLAVDLNVDGLRVLLMVLRGWARSPESRAGITSAIE